MTFLSANNSNLFSHQGQGLCISQFYIREYIVLQGFPGSSDSKESACNAGDVHLIRVLGRFLEEGMVTAPVFLPGESPWTEEAPGRSS